MGRGTRTVRDQFSAIFGNRRGTGQEESPASLAAETAPDGKDLGAPPAGLSDSLGKGMSMSCFAPWEELDPDVTFILGDGGPETLGECSLRLSTWLSNLNGVKIDDGYEVHGLRSPHGRAFDPRPVRLDAQKTTVVRGWLQAQMTHRLKS